MSFISLPVISEVRFAIEKAKDQRLHNDDGYERITFREHLHSIKRDKFFKVKKEKVIMHPSLSFYSANQPQPSMVGDQFKNKLQITVERTRRQLAANKTLGKTLFKPIGYRPKREFSISRESSDSNIGFLQGNQIMGFDIHENVGLGVNLNNSENVPENENHSDAMETYSELGVSEEVDEEEITENEIESEGDNMNLDSESKLEEYEDTYDEEENEENKNGEGGGEEEEEEEPDHNSSLRYLSTDIGEERIERYMSMEGISGAEEDGNKEEEKRNQKDNDTSTSFIESTT